MQELSDGRVVFVESNKLTVRYHTIDPHTVAWLRHQLTSTPETLVTGHRSTPETLVTDLTQEAVFSWSGANTDHWPLRAPVLPDLRCGAGFTLLLIINTALVSGPGLLVDAVTTVSGSLDEEDAEDIEKGFRIIVGEEQDIKLLVTDGFGVDFEFKIENLDAEHLKRSVNGFVQQTAFPLGSFYIAINLQ